jgi:4-amino-4-deoxy-L-arabinose transferase-like glycosyltransferase
VGTVASDASDTSPAARRRGTVPRWVLLAVALLGMAHALVYVCSVPPWGLEDEEQHVDYVLTLRDSFEPPDIRQHVHPAIIASAIATDRYTALGLGTTPPAGTDASALGLEGLSYEGHQPPLYYSLMAPFVTPLGDHTLATMYTLRVIDAFLVGVLAALTAALAARWARRGWETTAALFAGVAVAAVPAIVEAGARVSNDLLVTVFVTATLLACTLLLERPTMRTAWLVGGAAATAVLTKTTGLVTLLAICGALLVIAARREPVVRIAAACLAPPIVAAGAWALVTHARYGVWRGDSAFLLVHRPFPSLPFDETFSRTLREAAFPDGQWGVPLALCILFAAAVAIGVVLALVDRRARPLAGGALLVSAGLAFGYLLEIDRGLVTTSPRLLIPAYPALLAAAGCGYVSLRRRWLPLTIVAVGAVLAITFFVLQFSPRYPFRVR